jgi:hypothetical protein
MPQRSTLARSTANGNVSTIVIGPAPGSVIALPAGYSTPFTEIRTTLPGSRRGDEAGVDAAGDLVLVTSDGASAVGVGEPPLSVPGVPHAESASTHARKSALIPTR